MFYLLRKMNVKFTHVLAGYYASIIFISANNSSTYLLIMSVLSAGRGICQGLYVIFALIRNEISLLALVGNHMSVKHGTQFI